jgi:hypothetical protein
LYYFDARTNINNKEQVGVAVKLWDRIREELRYRMPITLRLSVVFFSASMEVEEYYLDLATRASIQNHIVCILPSFYYSALYNPVIDRLNMTLNKK